jgi:hypothetical protein
LLFLNKNNGFIIMDAHEVYMSVVQFLDYVLTFIDAIFLKGCPDLLIRPPLFSLISRISLPDLGGISSEVQILNLRSNLVFPGCIFFGCSKSFHHSLHISG